MTGYSPLKITGNSTGLVQERENFLLPDDAYPILQNAYVWRERIKRKKGFQLLGRLQRTIGTTDGAGNAVIVITPFPLNTGISSFQIGIDIFTDPGTTADPGVQVLLTNSSGTGTLNRVTGTLTITGSQVNTSVEYFPGLPVMGLRIREKQNSTNDETIAFDQVYAYTFDSIANIWKEFIPGTTWNAAGEGVDGTSFFWSTNYWTSSTPIFTTNNQKLFWVTNNTGQFAASGASDPPRITDGITWVDFFPSTWSQIDATNFLTNWLCMIPFRGRLVTFNTWEGPTAAASVQYSNRIRWSRIGNPFIAYSAGPPATGSWRDDIRGQGGFLDIPTSEDIVSIGFVRDNLVIYCERSTWQLRYTGRSIAPFQIEKVNSELGTEGTFSAIQFDTSLIGIGDKGIVECDSYKSERIDIKIPDYVFRIQDKVDNVNKTNSSIRVHGIRDFINRLAFWTVPTETANGIFPDQRLVYNYENDSWALFNDSFTCFGNYQAQSSRTWLNTKLPWILLNFPWLNQPSGDPVIVAGNQQGFVEILTETITTNDVSIFIQNITGKDTLPTVITSPNHNLQTGAVIRISQILATDPFVGLNGQVFGVVVIDANSFKLMKYSSITGQFSEDQEDSSAFVYQGFGYIAVRDNFTITSKKFNFLDEGQSIQLGFIDILMDKTGGENPGAISLNVYLDYNDSTTSNTLPKNDINNGVGIPTPDTFFNATIPTTSSTLNSIGGTKFWQRVFCPTRANFITLEYTFSNAQMAGEEQELDVQIDAQVLWIRKAGRMTQI